MGSARPWPGRNWRPRQANMTTGCPLPEAAPETGLHVLRGLARDRSLLTAMSIMRDEVGPAFRITLPGFQPAVMVGPDSNRQIMVSQREHLRFRNETDLLDFAIRGVPNK